MYYDYLGLDSDYAYSEYARPIFEPSIINVEGANTLVSSVNGASGPNVNLQSTVGFTFSNTGAGTVTMTGTLGIANGGTGATSAAVARTNLEAAKSGVNTDITQLNGASQVDVSVNYLRSGVQVVGARGAAVPDAAGGATIDAEARAAINAVLARLRAHGLIES